MSRIRRGSILLCAACLLGTNFQLSAQERIPGSDLKAPFAPKLADALVGEPPAVAQQFNTSADKTAAQEKALEDLVVQLMAPCMGDCPNDTCEHCSEPTKHSPIQHAPLHPISVQRQTSCDCPQCEPNSDPAPSSDAVSNGISAPIVADGMDEYCSNMASLLAKTLPGSDSGDQTAEQVALRQQAIESAMQLVAQTAAAKAEAKIANLESSHQAAIYQLQTQLNRFIAQADSVDQLRDWLGPIYNNQNRNYQQMQLVAANNATMNRTLALLEKQIELAKPDLPSQTIRNHTIASADYVTSEPIESIPQMVVNRPADPLPPDNADEIQRLRSQLSQLQTRLNQLQRTSVRSAGHLEPVFTPDKPLRPIYDR